MDNFDDNNDLNNIVHYQGIPEEPQKPNEKGFWQKLREKLFPTLKKGEDLAEEFAHSKLDAQHAQNQASFQDAADKAAKVEEQKIKNKALDIKTFNDEVERIYSNTDLPLEAKELQIHNLLAHNPHILEQQQKIRAMIKALALNKGTRVDISDHDPSDLALPAASSESEDNDSD